MSVQLLALLLTLCIFVSVSCPTLLLVPHARSCVSAAVVSDRVSFALQVNYHPNKHERMLAIVDRYVKGNMKALDPFPDGSEYR